MSDLVNEVELDLAVVLDVLTDLRHDVESIQDKMTRVGQTSDDPFVRSALLRIPSRVESCIKNKRRRIVQSCHHVGRMVRVEPRGRRKNVVTATGGIRKK
jgi:hypothetical protein